MSTLVINALQGKTIGAGVGMLVASTGSGTNYIVASGYYA